MLSQVLMCNLVCDTLPERLSEGPPEAPIGAAGMEAKGGQGQELLAQEIAFCRFPFSSFSVQIENMNEHQEV